MGTVWEQVVNSEHYLRSAEEHDGDLWVAGEKSGEEPSHINTLSSSAKEMLNQLTAHGELLSKVNGNTPEY
jgi:hypothetical protein